MYNFLLFTPCPFLAEGIHNSWTLLQVKSFFFLSAEFLHQLSFAHTITVAANGRSAKMKSARRVSKYDSRGPKKHAHVFTTTKNAALSFGFSAPCFPNSKKWCPIQPCLHSGGSFTSFNAPQRSCLEREERTPWRATAQAYEDDCSLHDSEHSLTLLVAKCAGSYFQEWGTCL